MGLKRGLTSWLGNAIKRLPHPGYGNYGGYYVRCKTNEKRKKNHRCPVPIDKLDKQFQKHDKGMSNKDLVKNLKKMSPRGLSPYGKLYRVGAITVFSVAVFFGG